MITTYDFGDNASDYSYDWNTLANQIVVCDACGKKVRFGACDEVVNESIEGD